jgi:mannitol-1-/sugar-/sorbitol-6-phosphatase
MARVQTLDLSSRRLPCRAVLFDSDGVLVESDASVTRAWGAWAERYGLDPVEVIGSVHGRLVGQIVDGLLPAADRAEGLQAIIELEREDAASVTPIPGAVELLTHLGTAAPLPWAIVTSGESVLALARLAAAGVPLPATVVTGDDVVRGKPDPAPYLLAAARLGVVIEECVVVEDSPAGVQAARTAGAGGVLGVGPRAEQLDVDARVLDLRAVTVDAAGLVVAG